jgi:excisionase family DNA binding protein
LDDWLNAADAPGPRRFKLKTFVAELSPVLAVCRCSRLLMKGEVTTPKVAVGFTVKEIAIALQVSPAFIYREIKRGNLTAIRYNRRVLRVSVKAFEAWEIAHTIEAIN